MKYNYKSWLLACLALLLFLRPMLGVAAPFTPGNIIIARVGDGSTALTSAATAVFLDEYTPAGVLVQTIDLPTSVANNNRILTASGTAITELNLTRSADGHYLVLTGYGAVPGTPTVNTSLASDVARVIGLIGADGTFDTSTSTGDAFSGSNIRSATTIDGTSFYSVGGNSGVRYGTLGSFATTQLNTAPTNIRYINTFGGNLYISSGSGPYIGLSQVGTGLPTTAPQNVTLLPGFPGATAGSSPYAFYFADLSATVPGIDVVYVADDRTNTSGGIQKWSLVAGTWVLNGTIASTAAAPLRGLSGQTAGTTVSLVATAPTGFFLLSDNAGYNAAPSAATVGTALPSTPITNIAFRGVSFAPTASAPTIVSFTPASGPAGTVVTVTGTNFTGATAVALNGLSIAGFSVVDATTITFTVPAGATSGAIAVTTTGGTATSTTTFTVVVPNPVPTITSISPATAVAGSADFLLTVNGTGFVSGSVINFSGTALTTTFVSATQLTATVPAAAVATAGTIPVTVTSPAPGGGTSAASTFTVTVPAPTITGFTPTAAASGATVTITGTNLAGATAVTLNGVAIMGFTVANGTTITFTVPAGATSGTIAVTTPGGTATSTGTFTFLPVPTIASFTPASGPVGTVVMVTGTNFTGATALTLNGVAITGFSVVNATTITFTVPAGATSGAIAVTTPGGTATSATPFTVTVPATPTLSTLSPARAVVGGPAFVLTVSGTNLTATTQVNFRSVNYTAATVDMTGTSITVNIPASAISTVGQFTVTATNGGTASNPLDFAVVATASTVAFEDFEQGTRTSYTDSAPVLLRSGSWTFTQALIGDLFNDRVSQAKSARIRGGGSIAMNFDKPNGAGIVTVSAATFGTDTGATFTAEVSTDGGATYQPIAGAPATLTSTLTAYQLTVNRAGNVRLRFGTTNAAASANPRINIDDVTITNFVGTATTASQALPGLLVYPNPVVDRLTVALPTAGAATVALRDLTGRVVLAPAPLAADQQLHLPVNLAAGVYLLEVQQNGVLAVRRIEKK